MFRVVTAACVLPFAKITLFVQSCDESREKKGGLQVVLFPSLRAF